MLARFHGAFGIEAAKQLFAPLRVHGGEFAHEFVPGFPLRVTTPTDAESKERGYGPDGDVSSSNQGKMPLIVKFGIVRVLPRASSHHKAGDNANANESDNLDRHVRGDVNGRESIPIPIGNVGRDGSQNAGDKDEAKTAREG